ncbi:MAG: 50S ribosomal protein L17 [Coriobacteriia bacterium]|nr:50S ribosomal protein L17 [Coriobacteriia bacterium]
MRHYKKGRKLGTDASHTKAIKKNLCVALFTNDRIKTTLERAKEVRGDVDRIITWAKRGDVHSRRLAIAKLGNKDLVAEIFSKVEQGMFKDRNGGYTRILKLGTRRGDAAVIVIMELVLEPVRKKTVLADKAETAKKGGITGRRAAAAKIAAAKPAAAAKQAAKGKKAAEAKEAVDEDEIIDIEAELIEADDVEDDVTEDAATDEAPVDAETSNEE